MILTADFDAKESQTSQIILSSNLILLIRLTFKD